MNIDDLDCLELRAKKLRDDIANLIQSFEVETEFRVKVIEIGPDNEVYVTIEIKTCPAVPEGYGSAVENLLGQNED